ncbi:MAG: (d)CMP kinase [Candidatus Edwardsbacteria bacterium]
MNKRLIIAIDGPAASGKSTTAKLVARRLGYQYIDTGAMYRAFAFKAIKEKISTDDWENLEQLAKRTEIIQKTVNSELHTFLDGVDVTEEIRLPEVAKASSPVSAVPLVRRKLVALQQEMGKKGGVVLEGRDTTTVVFPEADVKIYMTASPKIRAERRQKELKQKGINHSLTEIIKEIKERDKRDSSRSDSPLRKARDAIVLDTTSLSVEEETEMVLKIVASRK